MNREEFDRGFDRGIAASRQFWSWMNAHRLISVFALGLAAGYALRALL